MNQITGNEWIDWAREQIRSGTEEARELVKSTFGDISVENRMHWMPYVLEIPNDSLRNFMVNIDLLTEEEYVEAQSSSPSNPASWFEILKNASKAFELNASEFQDFFPLAEEVLKADYQIESIKTDPLTTSFRFEGTDYSSAEESLPAINEMLHDFLQSQNDPRRFCFLESSVPEEQPVVFGKPQSVNRLLKRLNLGDSLVMSND